MPTIRRLSNRSEESCIAKIREKIASCDDLKYHKKKILSDALKRMEKKDVFEPTKQRKMFSFDPRKEEDDSYLLDESSEE